MPSNLPKTITGNPGFGLDVKKDSFHLQSLPSILLLTGDGRHTTLLGSHSSGCLSYSLSSSFPTHPVILPECTGRWTWLGALVDVSNRPGFKRARSASGRSVSLFGYIYIYIYTPIIPKPHVLLHPARLAYRSSWIASARRASASPFPSPSSAGDGNAASSRFRC